MADSILTSLKKQTDFKSKKEILPKVLVGVFAILFFALFPALLGLGGAWITEQMTGHRQHEGNSFWMALPWLCMLTIPAGAIALVIFTITAIFNVLKLYKKS